MPNINTINIGGTSYDIQAKSYSGQLPIANGGTGASTATEALAALGGVSFTLLWANANPTSSFGAQSVAVDLDPYDFVFIRFRANYNENVIISSVDKIVVGNKIRGMTQWNYRQMRDATITATGLTFGDGGAGNYNASVSTQNLVCIPQEIYGIKGVS